MIGRYPIGLILLLTVIPLLFHPKPYTTAIIFEKIHLYVVVKDLTFFHYAFSQESTTRMNFKNYLRSTFCL